MRVIMSKMVADYIRHPVKKILGGQKSKVKIPYGRHTYGTHPRIIGSYPWVKRLSEGSRIGSFCSIASGVTFFFLGVHRYDWVTTYPFHAIYDEWKTDAGPFHRGKLDMNAISPEPIIIGNDVWLATNASIMQGVKVGDGAVIAMESLVTKDVPPYAIVGGNPARIVKYRFSQKQIEELLKIAWWNWEDSRISEVMHLLLSDDIDEFIRVAVDMMARSSE